jgi:hypothetical protein
MRSTRSVVALALLAVAAPLSAQSASTCTTITADACQKSEDLFRYLIPQLGGALSGGNPILGSGDILGGLGHFSLGVRASAVRGSLPQFDGVSVSTTGRVASDIAVKDQWVPVPVVDAAIGIWDGIPLGVTRVGGIDALVSATYLPSIDGDEGSETSITLDDGNFKFGFGARVGLLQEAIIVPAVTFTYLQRGLPAITARAETDQGARLGVTALEMDVASWRLIATKSFLVFDLSAGFGSDKITTDGTIRASAPGSVLTESVGLDNSVTRSVMFAGLTLDLGPVAFTGEIGQASGGSLSTFNNFDPKATASRGFGSVGVRFGF